MIIGIWIALILCLGIIIGEIKYRFWDKKEARNREAELSKNWMDNMDAELDRCFIEETDSDFVPQQILSRRGSWRIAQNQILHKEIFASMRAEEYSKKL